MFFFLPWNRNQGTVVGLVSHEAWLKRSMWVSPWRTVNCEIVGRENLRCQNMNAKNSSYSNRIAIAATTFIGLCHLPNPLDPSWAYPDISDSQSSPCITGLKIAPTAGQSIPKTHRPGHIDRGPGLRLARKLANG